jgi:hypothetical protein
MQSSKSQTPNPKQIPNNKFQKPNAREALNHHRRTKCRSHWGLEFEACLGLGVWSLEFLSAVGDFFDASALSSFALCIAPVRRIS